MKPTGLPMQKRLWREWKIRKYDLIISDVMMKDMDGFEFAEAIRDMDDSIPIMFMTALDDIYSKTKGYKINVHNLSQQPNSCACC